METISFPLCLGVVTIGMEIGGFVDRTSIVSGRSHTIPLKAQTIAKISFVALAIVWTTCFILSNPFVRVYKTFFVWLIVSLSHTAIGIGIPFLLSLVVTHIIKTKNIIMGDSITRFRNANLTNSDFTEAVLTYVDLKGAILTHTCWLNAWSVKHAYVENTYLEDLQVLYLAVTKEGKEQKIYNNKSLRDINLKYANLVDVSFVDSDLSQADLQGANLSRAKLIRTRLDQADLTGACLTGAFIQDWGIKTTTKFSGVKCEYVYMRLPTKENPDPLRKPDNRNEIFEDGDFEDFIKPLTDTLDLYHNHGVDPRAIAIAFKNLAEDNPEAKLEIVAMEKRGQDKILLRAKTAPGISKSELSQAYFEDYNQLKALPAEQLMMLIAEKSDRIRSLENMVTTALQQPTFYAETYQHQGDFMPDNSGVNFNAGRDIGDISGVVGQNMTGVAGGDISGQVTNTINQLPASPQPDEPGIKELLEQLHQAIENAEELKPEDKAEALKQVQALAEAGKDPAEPEKKNGAKSAIRWLKGMLTELAEPSAIVQLCKHVLPHIATIFGL
jgi:uncharacterized protein YjbI with pentapeptide repeats